MSIKTKITNLCEGTKELNCITHTFMLEYEYSNSPRKYIFWLLLLIPAEIDTERKYQARKLCLQNKYIYSESKCSF